MVFNFAQDPQSDAARMPTIGPMNLRHLRRAQVFLGVAILVVGLATTPATAAEEPKGEQESAPTEAPPAGFRTWDELAEMQDTLNNAADTILSEAAEGYAGTVAAPENRGLEMYFKGGLVPDAVKARAERTGVQVKFLAARFSEDELVREVARVGADKRATSAQPNTDGSGITLTASNDADAEALKAEAQLPTTVTVDRSPELAFDRQNDISPYWGGAHWYNLNTGGQCSTGFAVRAANLPRMMSAAHCGSNGNLARIGNATQPPGVIVGDVNPRDTLLINPPQGRTFQGRIYTGPWNSASSLKVIGSAVDYVGNWICTSGSFSGEHCNAKVYAVNTSVLGIFPLTYAAKVPGIPAAGNCIIAPGDSGGPVFHRGLYFQWGWPLIGLGAVGRGTITAGVMDTPCLSLGVWRPGSYRVWYAPLRRPWWSPVVGSLTFYGATLL
jgi:hypothetical protein